MQKKLLAVAVAGALAAPVAAMAQSTTTATIYGTFSVSIESRSATGGDPSAAPATGATNSTRGGATNAGAATAAAAAAQLAVGGSAYTTNPADQTSRTASQSAGSNFGIRVREDLGSGMYAWVQAELSHASTGTSQPGATTLNIGPTYRNSGVAIGSNAWGDVILGLWDTPLNVNANPAPQHAPYSNASTSFSSQLLLGNPIAPGTVSGVEVTASCNPSSVDLNIAAAGTGQNVTLPTATFASTIQGCLAGAMSFHRRQANTLQYWSPTWSGFQVKVQYGAEQLRQPNSVAGSAAPAQPSVLKPYMWGGSLTYSAGPLYVGVGYETHKDFTAVAIQTYTAGSGFAVFNLGGSVAGGGLANFRGGPTGISGSNDNAWNFNIRYTFGAFTLGGYYERLKWNNSYGTVAVGDITDLGKKAWGLEGAWVSGPHTVGVRYAKANSMTGSANGVSFDGGSTGATGWIFGYGYSLSKRTALNLYHTRVTNDTNARYTGIVFNGIATATGADPRYTGVGIRHTF